MQWRRTAYGYALRLDPGEEIVASLKAFAGQCGVRAALLSGLGAVGEAEVGFFDRFEKKYLTRTFAGEHEIGSLTGNISELDGEPFPHCHILLSGPDLAGHTGHLFRGVVTVTCEIQVVTTPGRFLRTRRPELGFNPLDLSEEDRSLAEPRENPMPQTPERSARIQRIRELPRRLAAATAGLDDAQLDTPYREGGWTPRQVVHHVADSHMNAYIRMRLLLTEEHPTLRPYDQDTWARLPDSRDPIATSLALIEALHARWASLLEQVPADGWGRTGHHPESGTVTLDGLLAAYADHGENHVAQITGLRRARGW